MSTFSELIKNFSRTRDYVRDFFIYGCKQRGDFTRKSSRSYDDERRRVESWLGDYVRSDDSQRGRQISVSVDSGHILENPLYQAYCAKSFTDNDIRLHFLLLDLLADGGQYTLHELTDLLSQEYGAVFDEQTVRGKLREYCSEGLILSGKQGKTVYYRLSPETLEGLTAQYPGLPDAVRFFSEIQPFGVIGSSILRSGGLRNDCFLMKQNYIVRTLEDEILCTILDAMRAGRALRLTVSPTKSAFLGSATESEQTCVPLCISTSAQTGRRYLLAYQTEFARFNAYRLDFIRDVKPGAVCPDCAELAAKLRQDLPHVFGVSFGDRKTGGTAEPLRLTLRIPPEERFVLDRVKREIRSGTLEQTGENTYCVTLDVYDPREALPWIRTFTGRIVSLEGGNEDVRRLFREDTLAMARLYGEDAHDDIS